MQTINQKINFELIQRNAACNTQCLEPPACARVEFLMTECCSDSVKSRNPWTLHQI